MNHTKRSLSLKRKRSLFTTNKEQSLVGKYDEELGVRTALCAVAYIHGFKNVTPVAALAYVDERHHLWYDKI